MSQLYRSYAAQEEAYAAEASLANVRAMHERSAAKWRALADQAALTEQAAIGRPR